MKAATAPVSDSNPDIENVSDELDKKLEEIDYAGRHLSPRLAATIGGIAALWSVFQLWIASPLQFLASQYLGIDLILDLQKRAIHLAFALFLLFLIYPARRSWLNRPIGAAGLGLAVLAASVALYLFFAQDGLEYRKGILLVLPVDFAGFQFAFPIELLIGLMGIALLLEATRRAVGVPLVIVCLVFLGFAAFGRHMPDLISHGGISLKRLAGEFWLGGEAIFGIPISVSTEFVFLFVLFGALLDRAGAGKIFSRPCFRRRRPISRWTRESFNSGIGHDRCDFRLFDRQRRDDGYLHHPGHEKKWACRRSRPAPSRSQPRPMVN